jgi:hypothetical protein
MRRIWLLRHLTAAWLTTALLYASPVPLVPRPMAAFFVCILVASIAAVVTPLMSLGPFEPPERRKPLIGTRSSGWPGPSARPKSSHFQAVQPPPNRRDDPVVPDWSDGRHRSMVGETDQPQCPRCGSFATEVVRGEPERENSCRTCAQTWNSGASDTGPDVVIRSWLHR